MNEALNSSEIQIPHDKVMAEVQSLIESKKPMPTISEFFGIIISMYWDEHNPPHFHARYGGQKAIFDIATGKKMKGTFSKRGEKLVTEWALLHKQELIQDWDLCVNKKMPLKIQPLS